MVKFCRWAVIVTRDNYYVMYQKIVFNQYFYKEYQFSATTKNAICSVILVIVSILSATIWAISGACPLLWSFVIGLAQLAQALSDRFPWKLQLMSLKFLCPELSSLALKAELFWLDIDLKKLSDKEIKNAINTFSEQLEDVCNKLIGDTQFNEDEDTDIWKAATKKARLHFENRYYREEDSLLCQPTTRQEKYQPVK